MRELVRCQLWIIVAAVVICFVNLGRTGLWDMDEALYASCAREMLERRDWVEPRYNDAMFPEKPVLMFWTMMAGFGLTGPQQSELGARLFSALFGVATGLTTFHLGRMLFNVRVGFWAGLISVSTIIFTVSARAATVDAALMFFTTLAFFLFAAAWLKCRRAAAPAGDDAAGTLVRSRAPWLLMALMYASVGVAVLAKGPIGMLLPLAAMGLFLCVDQGWRNLLRAAWWMRPFTAVVVIAAVAAPWYVLVGLRTNWEWPRQFLLEFNLRPFRRPIQGHGTTGSLKRAGDIAAALGVRLIHIPFVLIGFFPWSVFMWPTIVDTIQRIRRDDRWRRGAWLMVCWFGVWFLFWSICKTKLPHYLLPAYPALALLTACFLERWFTAPATVKRWWLYNAWGSLIVVGLGIMIAVPFIAAQVLPGEAVLGLVGAIPLVGGLWCWRQAVHNQPQRALTAFAVAAVLFLTAMFGLGSVRVDRHQNARPLMAALHADCADAATAPLAIYRFLRYQYSTVYYANRPLGRPVTMCPNAETLQRFLDQSPRSYVVTLGKYVPEVKAAFPGKIRVVQQQRCFFGNGDDMVLLALEPAA